MHVLSLTSTVHIAVPRLRPFLPMGGLILAASVLAGCSGEPTLADVRAGRAAVTGQGVLVIAVDGLRWDHTSLSGYDRETTPYLASLAEDGIVFTDAWSPTPSLVGSHVAILSGSDPMLARPHIDQGAPGTALDDESSPWFIPEGLWLLGRSFLSRGWNTAAFVDDPQIAELTGFSVGFREFVEFGGDPLAKERSIGIFGVGRRFVQWANQRPLDEDWFAYVQMHDLERVWTSAGDLSKTPRVKEQTEHWTGRESLDFAVPLGVAEPRFHVLPPSRASDLRGVTMAEYELRYDRGIRALDANIARIIGHADEFGRGDNLTIVIVGSFGMELGENGFYLQAGLVEEEDLRVPVVIRPSAAIAQELGWDRPGAAREAGSPGRVSGSLMSLIDLAPTLADLLDLPTSGRMLGLSQRHAMMDAPVGDAAGDAAGKGPRIRQRLFASSSMPPGTAVVEDRALMTFYRPSEASAALRASWGLSSQPTSQPSSPNTPPLGSLGSVAGGIIGTFQSRIGDLPPSVELKAKFERAGASWDALVGRERRALHFGDSDTDRPKIGEFHLLQEGGTLD